MDKAMERDALKCAANPTREIFDGFYIALVSCSYCVEALRASKAGQIEQAWAFAASASYWCGVMVGDDTRRRGIEPVKTHLRARSAAMKRHKSNHAMKQKVLEWMEQNGHRFRSKDAAAEAIVAEKVAPVTFRTARNWLRESQKK